MSQNAEQNFWAKLSKPFFVLAPLANVTDAAFRRLIAKYGKPDVMYTEFVSADGLLRANEVGKSKLMRDLLFTEAERPIVAQFFTSDPEAMEYAARLAQEMGFDGVDINMGCPDKTVEKQGAGAKLILNPERAKELILAARLGAPNLPVSVKTRLGYNKDTLEDWIPALLIAEPSVITLHARTRKEMSKVPARWERVKRAVEIRDEMKSKTLIIGNGDVKDIEDAKIKIAETGADGAMLGRAIFGTPWLFEELPRNAGAGNNFPGKSGLAERSEEIRGPFLQENYSALGEKPPAQSLRRSLAPQPTVPEVLRILVEHVWLFQNLLGDIKSFALMKKHFKAYVEGFDGAKELRVQLMETTNAVEVENIIEVFLTRYTK